MSDNVIPISRKKRNLLHTVEAGYSAHTYDVFKVHPPAQITRTGSQGSTEDAPYVVVNSLNPRYYVSAHTTEHEAVRAAQAIRDQHYTEYMEVLAAEVDRRGYTDQDVIDVVLIMWATDLYRRGMKLRRPQQRKVEALMRQHPAEEVTEALQLHAQQAKELWDAAGHTANILTYVKQVTRGD